MAFLLERKIQDVIFSFLSTAELSKCCHVNKKLAHAALLHFSSKPYALTLIKLLASYAAQLKNNYHFTNFFAPELDRDVRMALTLPQVHLVQACLVKQFAVQFFEIVPAPLMPPHLCHYADVDGAPIGKCRAKDWTYPIVSNSKGVKIEVTWDHAQENKQYLLGDPERRASHTFGFGASVAKEDERASIMNYLMEQNGRV